MGEDAKSNNGQDSFAEIPKLRMSHSRSRRALHVNCLGSSREMRRSDFRFLNLQGDGLPPNGLPSESLELLEPIRKIGEKEYEKNEERNNGNEAASKR